MKELADILRAIDEGRGAVLATLVAAEGSSYRRAGARMLIGADGGRVGTISGGCLEEDLTRRAGEMRVGDRPVVVRYATGSEEDAVWGYGSGCKGAVHVLLERIEAQSRPGYVGFLRECRQTRRRGALATVWAAEGDGAAEVGARLMVGRERMVSEGTWAEEVAKAVEEDARRVMETARSENKVYEQGKGRVHVLVEVVRPAVRLVIMGAGDNAGPVVRMAGELGWTVVVCDRRPAYAKTERFPGAHAVVLCAPDEVEEWLEPDENTAALVITHRYAEDLALLRVLVAMPLGYVGILGARQRTRQLLEDLAKEGMSLGEQQRARLHAPVGLDIGAETAEEIALAVVAEVQAVMAGRPGGKLKDRQGAIHGPAKQAREVRA